MNKTYLAIISILLVVAIAVGGYAVYQTVNQPTAPIVPPPAPAPEPLVPTPATKSATPKDTMPLSISAPRDGDTFTRATITVTGKTSPKAEVAINDKDLIADSTGTFSTTLVLDEGENPIMVTVSDDAGNLAEKEITVTYNVPQ